MSAGRQYWCISLVLPSNWMFRACKEYSTRNDGYGQGILFLYGALFVWWEKSWYTSIVMKGVTPENKTTDFCLLWSVTLMHRIEGHPHLGSVSRKLWESYEPLALYISPADCFLWCLLYVPPVCLPYVHIESLTQTPALNMRSFTQLLKPKT